MVLILTLCAPTLQFEANNSYTRNLTALQAFVMYLDVGMWSGVKRKMEIAESFCQPVLTVSISSSPIDFPWHPY